VLLTAIPPPSRWRDTFRQMGNLLNGCFLGDAGKADMLANNPWALHPEKTKACRHWDIVMFLTLSYTSVVAWFEVGFWPVTEEFDSWFWINRAVDVVYFMDLFLQFFLQYETQTQTATVWVNRSRMIALHYLRTWFLFDLLSNLPYDCFYIISKETNGGGGKDLVKLAKAVRFLKVFKMIRFSRMARFWTAWKTFQNEGHWLVQITTFMLKMLVIGNWMACLMGLIGDIQEPDMFLDGSPTTWIQVELGKGTKREDSFGLWVAAMHFAIMTLTSIGYGDVVPISDNERMVTIVLMVIGTCVWAELLSAFTTNAAMRGQREREFGALMRELSQATGGSGLTKPLCRQVQKYFNQKYLYGDIFDRMTTGMLPLMSVGLAREVAVTMNETWSQNVAFLQDVSLEFQAEVSMKLQQRIYTGGERFGEVWHLYALRHGLVARKGVLRILSRGSTWGEDVILSDITLMEDPSVFCLAYTEVLIFSKADLEEILRELPREQHRIRKYVVRLAGRRGLLRNAIMKRRDVPCMRRRLETFVQLDRIQRMPSFLVAASHSYQDAQPSPASPANPSPDPSSPRQPSNAAPAGGGGGHRSSVDFVEHVTFHLEEHERQLTEQAPQLSKVGRSIAELTAGVQKLAAELEGKLGRGGGMSPGSPCSASGSHVDGGTIARQEATLQQSLRRDYSIVPTIGEGRSCENCMGTGCMACQNMGRIPIEVDVSPLREAGDAFSPRTPMAEERPRFTSSGSGTASSPGPGSSPQHTREPGRRFNENGFESPRGT